MTSGERRAAQRLEDQLDNDHLLWYEVLIGPKNAPRVPRDASDLWSNPIFQLT